MKLETPSSKGRSRPNTKKVQWLQLGDSKNNSSVLPLGLEGPQTQLYFFLTKKGDRQSIPRSQMESIFSVKSRFGKPDPPNPPSV